MTHMNTRQRVADGLVIRYAEADGAGDETVLLLNPWPESLFAWDTIWTRLAQTARLVAIDLPGFGQSERGAELLSPRHRLPEAVREDYLTSYAGDRFVESMAYVRSYPSELRVLTEQLSDIRTPVQIIAGRHDVLVPPSNAEFLHARLAHSKLDILETGHFAWEDGADDYLELTRSWIEAHRIPRSSR